MTNRRRATSPTGAWPAVPSSPRPPIYHLTQCKASPLQRSTPQPSAHSHSYVFGGMAAKTKDSDGNVYVLSVPSFRWIKVYDDHVLRYKHKCVLAQKHTMLAVGGIIPIDDMEYYPQSRNCDSSTFANGIGIFDLRKLSWMSNYNADDHGEYTIPSKIVDVIGGRYVCPMPHNLHVA